MNQLNFTIVINIIICSFVLLLLLLLVQVWVALEAEKQGSLASFSSATFCSSSRGMPPVGSGSASRSFPSRTCPEYLYREASTGIPLRFLNQVKLLFPLRGRNGSTQSFFFFFFYFWLGHRSTGNIRTLLSRFLSPNPEGEESIKSPWPQTWQC